MDKLLYRIALISIVILVLACKNTTDVLVEPEDTPSFTWDNATVYFLLTDRFNNADKSNDFQHFEDAAPAPYRGFMGGDVVGITQKIKEGYFTDLGVNALWMTPLVEQIKGSTDEGTGMSYPFHGYWARDWTAIDPRFGTAEEVEDMVSAAHDAGIRVIFDVVANHIGPVTDMDPVWPAEWVKTEPKCDFQTFKGTTDCTLVENLPDIRTESDQEVDLPPYLVTKWKAEGRYDQEVAELDTWFEETGYRRTAVNYILKWLVDFIKEYGIDGFRVDTVKHTEPYVWNDLWKAAVSAFEDWKDRHPDEVLDEAPFYMVGEVYNYYISGGRAFDFGDQKVDFYDNGFHALINFDFKGDAKNSYEEIFSKYDRLLQGELAGKSVVNYISSHDDGGPYDLNRENPIDAGTKLLLCPGGVQIYYGDESARSLTVEAEGDATLRSFMNWEAISTDENTQNILKHWGKLGQFRNDHPAVGAGKHDKISDAPYTFSRIWNDDKVVIALAAAPGAKTIGVGGVFAEGTTLTDRYSGQSGIVQNGEVTIESGDSIVLLERS